jgi:hypothetical protein
MSKIMVEIDFCEGLPKVVEIELGKWKYWQVLSYWKNPFLYIKCHAQGNMVKDFPFYEGK